MLAPTDERSTSKRTLGQYLASIRVDRKMSLRDVEEATSKQVSNAYLSQIENDKIKKPSPNILHALAEFYAISFENLMDLAGTYPARSGLIPSATDVSRHSLSTIYRLRKKPRYSDTFNSCA
jgi:transcriptional regulator with XRE-family HTH domain